MVNEYIKGIVTAAGKSVHPLIRGRKLVEATVSIPHVNRCTQPFLGNTLQTSSEPLRYVKEYTARQH